jgi:pyruvate,water dikinase
MSDFKSNEYANLIGGKLYEPEEENPMLGFRGASRYISDNFRDCFDLEVRALKKVRNEMGLTNVEVMIPFVRTTGEAKRVLELLAEKGLKRGDNGLRVIMMCELPTNALLAEDFLEHFDGFSIGSNDLTQLTLGLDRDSGIVSHLFDERDPAVKFLLSRAIQACKKAGQIHRHLWPGALGSPGSGQVADGRRHRYCVAEPGLGAGYLVLPGRKPRQVSRLCVNKKGGLRSAFFIG